MKSIKYFSAKWCGPCRAFRPIMQEVVSEGQSVQFIDIDKQTGIVSIQITRTEWFQTIFKNILDGNCNKFTERLKSFSCKNGDKSGVKVLIFQKLAIYLHFSFILCNFFATLLKNFVILMC